jgi:hypothetical protein
MSLDSSHTRGGRFDQIVQAQNFKPFPTKEEGFS